MITFFLYPQILTGSHFYLFFTIFGAMKKWLITYLLIVCGICLHLCGFANTAKTSHTGNNNATGYTSTPRSFTFKKALPSLYNYTDTKDAGIFFHHQSIRVLNSVVFYYTTEQNFFLLVSCHVSGEAINTREVERVLKDHLVHLYPSHYFW